MVYKLHITEHAEELLDGLLYHLIFRLKNEQAAKHLLNEVDKLYSRLEDNPFQFPRCRDYFLADKGYYEAILSEMDYIIVFSVQKDTINIVGIFHQLENYPQNNIFHD